MSVAPMASPTGGPDGFVVNEQYTWIDCPVEGYEGVRAEVRVNLSQGRRKALVDALDALQDRINDATERYTAEAVALDAEFAATPADDAVARHRLIRRQRELLRAQQRELDALLAERHPLIAPHVRAWNLFLLDDQGRAEPLPPPAVAGATVFEEVDTPFVTWLTDELLVAYRGGRKPKGSSIASAGSQEPTNEPTSGSDNGSGRSTPASRKRSSGRTA